MIPQNAARPLARNDVASTTPKQSTQEGFGSETRICPRKGRRGTNRTMTSGSEATERGRRLRSSTRKQKPTKKETHGPSGAVKRKHRQWEGGQRGSRQRKTVLSGRKAKRPSPSPSRYSTTQWEMMFQRLVGFKRNHGHCLVPNRYRSDAALGAWVSTQRRQYKNLVRSLEGESVWKKRGKKDRNSTILTHDRMKRLDDEGFAWEVDNPRRVPWDLRFQELVAFEKKHGKIVELIV